MDKCPYYIKLCGEPRCNGTREQDICSCDGDKANCNFYTRSKINKKLKDYTLGEIYDACPWTDQTFSEEDGEVACEKCMFNTVCCRSPDYWSIEEKLNITKEEEIVCKLLREGDFEKIRVGVGIPLALFPSLKAGDTINLIKMCLEK